MRAEERMGVKVVGISEGHSGIIVKTMPRKLLSNWMLWG